MSDDEDRKNQEHKAAMQALKAEREAMMAEKTDEAPGLPPVAPVPAKAAPDDDRHQQQKPVPCRLSDQLVNLGRHSKVARKRDAA